MEHWFQFEFPYEIFTIESHFQSHFRSPFPPPSSQLRINSSSWSLVIMRPRPTCVCELRFVIKVRFDDKLIKIMVIMCLSVQTVSGRRRRRTRCPTHGHWPELRGRRRRRRMRAKMICHQSVDNIAQPATKAIPESMGYVLVRLSRLTSQLIPMWLSDDVPSGGFAEPRRHRPQQQPFYPATVHLLASG